MKRTFVGIGAMSLFVVTACSSPSPATSLASSVCNQWVIAEMNPIDSRDLTSLISLARGAVRQAEEAGEPTGAYGNLVGRLEAFATLTDLVRTTRQNPDMADRTDSYLEGLVSLGNQIDSACITIKS